MTLTVAEVLSNTKTKPNLVDMTPSVVAEVLSIAKS